MISAFQNCSKFVNWTYFGKWSTLPNKVWLSKSMNSRSNDLHIQRRSMTQMIFNTITKKFFFGAKKTRFGWFDLNKDPNFWATKWSFKLILLFRFWSFVGVFHAVFKFCQVFLHFYNKCKNQTKLLNWMNMHCYVRYIK